jgi:mono/diheme cytochrome c family protein
MKENIFPTVLLVLVTITIPVLVGCAGRPALPASVELTSPRVAEGQKIYMAVCNQCHPGGAAGVGPSLYDKPLPAFLVRFQVRHGLGAMPAFSKEYISDDQLDALVAYVEAMRRQL